MPNADDVSLLAFVKNEEDVVAIRAFAAEQQLGEENVFMGDIAGATEHLATHEPPRLLIVETNGKNQADVSPELDRLADVCSPETKVVVVGTVNEYSFFCWLQEIGIFHYLLKPITPEALAALYSKLMAKTTSAESTERKLGKTIGIIGTRGGSGASSIAILLAAISADRMKKPTALVDLDPQDGSSALLLDLEPSRGFRDALEKPDRMDGLFLERVMVKANEHLSLLSAEESLHENIHFTEEAADALVPLLQEKFAYSFLDVSHHFNPFSLKCLRLCDQIFVVSPLNLQGLRDAMRIDEWLRERCQITTHMFIANKAGESAQHEVIQADFEKSLNSKLTEIFPYAPKLFSEITNDLAVVKKTSLEGYKQLENIIKIINPAFKTSATAEPKGKKMGLGILKKK